MGGALFFAEGSALVLRGERNGAGLRLTMWTRGSHPTRDQPVFEADGFDFEDSLPVLDAAPTGCAAEAAALLQELREKAESSDQGPLVHHGEQVPDAESLTRADHCQLLTDDDLADLPPLEWDIDGVLPTGGLNYLIGPAGVGKSLLALWWACCIGLGRNWYGRSVKRGRVIYVAAEGSRSLRK
jgi:hypothetical protein